MEYTAHYGPTKPVTYTGLYGKTYQEIQESAKEMWRTKGEDGLLQMLDEWLELATYGKDGMSAIVASHDQQVPKLVPDVEEMRHILEETENMKEWSAGRIREYAIIRDLQFKAVKEFADCVEAEGIC